MARISESESTADTTIHDSTTTSTSTTPQVRTFNNIPKYMKILVPHNRSEMSDKHYPMPFIWQNCQMLKS